MKRSNTDETERPKIPAATTLSDLDASMGDEELEKYWEVTGMKRGPLLVGLVDISEEADRRRRQEWLRLEQQEQQERQAAKETQRIEDLQPDTSVGELVPVAMEEKQKHTWVVGTEIGPMLVEVTPVSLDEAAVAFWEQGERDEQIAKAAGDPRLEALLPFQPVKLRAKRAKF